MKNRNTGNRLKENSQFHLQNILYNGLMRSSFQRISRLQNLKNQTHRLLISNWKSPRSSNIHSSNDFFCINFWKIERSFTMGIGTWWKFTPTMNKSDVNRERDWNSITTFFCCNIAYCCLSPLQLNISLFSFSFHFISFFKHKMKWERITSLHLLLYKDEFLLIPFN